MVLEPLWGVFGSLLSLSGILSLLVNVVITMIVIMIVSKVISHEANAKHCFIMAFVSYLIAPLVISYLILFVPAIVSVAILLPLIVWVILGEALLSGGRKQNLIIAVIAYVVNLFLLAYVSGYVLSLLP
jgi:hypothetical protein